MTAPVWPSTLPQTPKRGTFNGGPRDNRRKFVPDHGQPILRRATTAIVMAYQGVVFPNLSNTQRTTFETFFDTTLVGGTIPFQWADPVTGTNWLWIIEGDGDLSYRIVARGAALHDLTLNLLRKPGGI